MPPYKLYSAMHLVLVLTMTPWLNAFQAAPAPRGATEPAQMITQLSRRFSR